MKNNKTNKMQELIKLNMKATVLEAQVKKLKILLECWKSENRYSNELISKANQEILSLKAQLQQ
jgi:hypothetical protein